MSWVRVTSDSLETRTGLVVEVDDVDGSVNIRTDGGTWQMRPHGDEMKVLLDVRKGRLLMLGESTNSVLLRMGRH